jgi:hypothetical protein
MTKIRSMLGLCAGAVMLLGSVGAHAEGILKVTGESQGKFKGGALRDPAGEVVTRLIDHGATRPKDYNGLRAKGGKAKIHEPITVYVRGDADIATLWKTALTKHEKLQVDISFFGDGTGVVGEFKAGNKDQLIYSIKLRDAVAEKIEDIKVDASKFPNEKDTKANYVKVTLDFEEITFTDTHRSTTASDDWTI